MSSLKKTVLEISGNGDVELLDYLLSSFSLGALERKFRLLNVKPLEHLQFTLSRGGKTRVIQPFRAEFVTNTAGHYLAGCSGRYTARVAAEAVKQMGFTVVKVEPGDGVDQEISAGTTMNFSVSLNGRSAAVTITGSAPRGGESAGA
jgi:hypothetical protein